MYSNPLNDPDSYVRLYVRLTELPAGVPDELGIYGVPAPTQILELPVNDKAEGLVLIPIKAARRCSSDGRYRQI